MSAQVEPSSATKPKLIGPTKLKSLSPAAVTVSDVAGLGGLLTPKHVAKMLGVSVKALEKWRSLGKGPAVMRLTSKTLRYHLADVDAYIATNRG